MAQDGFDCFTPIDLGDARDFMAGVPHFERNLLTSVSRGRRSSSHAGAWRVAWLRAARVVVPSCHDSGAVPVHRLVVPDVEGLVRHAVSVELYRALVSCRRVTLAVVSRRLRQGTSFQLSEVGELSNLVAILKLSLAASTSGAGAAVAGSLRAKPGQLPVAWDIVRRLCESGSQDAVPTLIDQAALHMLTSLRHVVTLESKHPISDSDGFK